VTLPGKTPGEPESRRQADAPRVPAQRLAEENRRELQDDPHDLYDLFPDEYLPWLISRADYHIVVAQVPGWNPGGPPSLAEALETGRTREPEPDLEAEP
jgi:hypothetical protein